MPQLFPAPWALVLKEKSFSSLIPSPPCFVSWTVAVSDLFLPAAHSGALLSPEALWLKPMQAAQQGLWRKPGSRPPLWKRPASGSREVHSRFPHLLHVRTLVCCISWLLLPAARPRADRSPVSGCRSRIHDPGHQRDPAESLRGGGDPGRQR